MIPIPNENIDTDQIIPAAYLKVTDKAGLGEGLFSGWRYHPDGSPMASFPLNLEEFQGAQVLVAGGNFGCGSSREHAPWALIEWGFRAVISTSFADIFRNNALKNGLLPIEIDSKTHLQLLSLIQEDPKSRISIDLENQTVTLPDGRQANFHVDAFSKKCLLQGVDQMDYLLGQLPKITVYEQRAEKEKPLTLRA